jgi:hypothetical protein
MKLGLQTIEKYFQEFDPYLCSVVMDSLNRDAGAQIPLEKSNLVKHLKDQYKTHPEFANRIDENLTNVFDPSRIKDPNVMRRILDINLLYTLKFSYTPHLRIEGKVTGRALELLVESILKSKLKNFDRFYWEFVDWKSFDYIIVDRERNEWIVGIQCKTGFVGGFLSYQQELEKLKDFAGSFSIRRDLIMFCGGVFKSKKEEIRHAFENEGWEIYYLWRDINSYKIDESFYEFTNMIEHIVSA